MGEQYRFRGVVTQVADNGYYGFIRVETIHRPDYAYLGFSIDHDVFIHSSALYQRDLRVPETLTENMRVSFLLGPDANRPGKLVAEKATDLDRRR